jgi:hypothetical protein
MPSLLSIACSLVDRHLGGVRDQRSCPRFEARPVPFEGVVLVTHRHGDSAGGAVKLLEELLYKDGCSTRQVPDGFLVRDHQPPPEDLDALFVWAQDRNLSWEAKHPKHHGAPSPKGRRGDQERAAWKAQMALEDEAGRWAHDVVPAGERGARLLNVIAGLDGDDRTRRKAMACLQAIASSPIWPEALCDAAARAWVEQKKRDEQAAKKTTKAA